MFDDRNIEDPISSRHGPFVFFPLHEYDNGFDDPQRTTRPEYRDRQPFCVQVMGPRELKVMLTNVGDVISDLVRVRYQIVLCTDPGHGPDQGFTVSHALEVVPDPFDDAFHIATVLPGKSIWMPIRLPDTVQSDFSYWAHVYFRARAETLWMKKLPMDQWDFSSSPFSTEFTLTNP